MVMSLLFGEKCLRCDKKRTKSKFEGFPTCGECELEIRKERETRRLCPLDRAEMTKEVIMNVIVDRCSKCGGVWLEPGELELINKAINEGANAQYMNGLVLGMIIK
jgi:hypothetical protein